MGYAYDSQVVVPDGVRQTMGPDPVHDYVPSAVPGHRAPHLWLHDGVRPYSVLDLFGDAFVLLTDRVVEPDLPELVRRATAAEPIPLRVHVVGLHGDLACRDEWARTYGVRSGGMVLVRPDGHVCWRAAERPADTGSTVGRVLQTAVGRTAHLRPG
jgi:putative polyketide hydroxylase